MPTITKLNPKWVKETRDYFRRFLKETGFPHPKRNGSRGSKFDYPEWLIMLIGILSVKAKAKNYLAIHRLAVEYWPILTNWLPKTVRQNPISETQLRERLKKICVYPGKPPAFISQVFPQDYCD
jgi:hypothetical protein